MAQVLHKSEAFREAESRRQRALDAYRIVDTLPEAAFDDIAKVAAAVCDAPVALVSLIDRDRQWFKARVGTDVAETPRDEAVCDVAIRNPTELLEVADIASDPRFARAPSIAGVDGARFYAGMPLVTPGGAAIGAVCVVDRRPKRLVPRQRMALEALARITINLLEDRQREQVLARAAFLTRPPANEAPPRYTVVLLQLQGVPALVASRGERMAEQVLRGIDARVEASLDRALGDAIDRTTGSPEYVAVLHGDDPGPALARLRDAAQAGAREAGLSLCVGAATAEDGHEPLEAVFIRADERLAAEKDTLHPPPTAA